jgi:hypothetical protein
MKKNEELKHPFFANLLEAQKKPSSGDQQNLGITKQIWDQAQTQKWPSDGDDDIPPIEA